jgi:hypothetical protein
MSRFLLKDSFRIYSLICTIKEKIKINKHDALYLFINNDTILQGSKKKKNKKLIN